MPPEVKVYSYSRWSTPEQTTGDSGRRQLEAAELWAAKNGYLLDRGRCILDLGISAYRGNNAVDGALGLFLEACRQGLIERGSILLVESLDRISRMTPRKVQRLIDDIVDSGITIVTLCDDQHYTAERLDSDPIALLLALMVSWRAHEESRTKAGRVAAAWSEKRRQIREDPSSPFTLRAPSWLKRSPSGVWVEDRAKSDVVRRIFEMTLIGFGEHRIAATLNEEAFPTLCRGAFWHRSTVAKLLRNSAVIGKLTPGRIEYVNGRRLRILEDPVDGVFPAIVSIEDWLAVRALKDGRSGGPRGPHGHSGVAHYLAGLARCPRCGATMARVNKGATLKCGSPKLVCTIAKNRAGCQYVSVPIDPIEIAMLSQLPTLLNHAWGPERGNGSTAELDSDDPHVSSSANMFGTAEASTKRLQNALVRGETHPDNTSVNTALKTLFTGVEVNYLARTLHFRWRAGGEGTIAY